MPEKERLAYEEGHDADIPSNEGVVTAAEADRLESEMKVDPEKDHSSTASTTEPHGDVEKNQPTTTAEEEQQDPDIVDWDGPDDPANPLNWYGCPLYFNLQVHRNPSSEPSSHLPDGSV